MRHSNKYLWTCLFFYVLMQFGVGIQTGKGQQHDLEISASFTADTTFAPLRITTTYTNNTDSTIQLKVGCGGLHLGVDTLQAAVQPECLTNSNVLNFSPGDMYEIEVDVPLERIGLPSQERFPVVAIQHSSDADIISDTLWFEQDAFLGGQVDVSYSDTAAAEEKSTVRNIYKDYFISADTTGYRDVWFIEGIHPDTVIKELQGIEIVKSAYIRHASYQIQVVSFRSTGTSTEEGELLTDTAHELNLTQAYPNPFNPQTQLTLSVNEPQAVTVELFNLTGRKVKTLFRGHLGTGQQEIIQVDATGLASGNYIVVAKGEVQFSTRRITLIK